MSSQLAEARERLITAEELDRTLAEMRRLTSDGTVLAVMPRVNQVWARKPASHPLRSTSEVSG
jgi:hypothetical protein